jgi:hypothetical protein
MNIETIKNRLKNEYAIVIEEDYGACMWIWFPPVPASQLDKLWEGLKGLEYFPNRELPGELFCTIGDGHEGIANAVFDDIVWDLWLDPERHAVQYGRPGDIVLLSQTGKAVYHDGADKTGETAWNKAALSRIDVNP